MIAVLRVRFDSNKDLASVWSDDVTTAWMQLLRPWSLGNYWMVAGHGLLPLDSRVLPSVVMTDPRQPQLDVPTNRLRLTQGAADAATADHAVWDDIDILLLVFAQPTDMFGNGSATVTESDGRTKTIQVTVVDIQSTFVDCCQELGHSLGFDHELNAAGGSYASPYSCMSSRTSAAEFLRPAAAGLPVGTTITNPRDSMVGRDPQRVAGTLLTGAQLWTTPGFRGSPFVVELTRDYATRPARVRLYPPDWQSNQPPGPRPVLVAVPSNRGDGRMFFVEFRRHGTATTRVWATRAAGWPGLPCIPATRTAASATTESLACNWRRNRPTGGASPGTSRCATWPSMRDRIGSTSRSGAARTGCSRSGRAAGRRFP